MRKLRLSFAIIISFICVCSYLYNVVYNTNSVVVSGNTSLIIKHELIYENGLLIHYQSYYDTKMSNEQQIVSILNSLKGSLLPFDSKVLNVKEDGKNLIIEVNESFFTINKETNLKIAESLNLLRKIFYPNRSIRIYINNNELKCIPQTSLLVMDIDTAYPNLFSGDAVRGYPIVLMENDVLYTTYVDGKFDEDKLTQYFVDNLMFRELMVDNDFVDDIKLINSKAYVYLNDLLSKEDEVIDEDILSDYLILLFMNLELDSVLIYVNDEPYFYRGKDIQELNMSDIVYNLH